MLPNLTAACFLLELSQKAALSDPQLRKPTYLCCHSHPLPGIGQMPSYALARAVKRLGPVTPLGLIRVGSNHSNPACGRLHSVLSGAAIPFVRLSVIFFRSSLWI